MTQGSRKSDLLSAFEALLGCGQVLCRDFGFDECNPPIASPAGAVDTIVANMPSLLPELWPPFDAERLPQFEPCESGAFAEELAQLLLRFGVYKPFSGTIQDARRMASRFVAEMVTPDWSRAWIGRNRNQWSPAFASVIHYTALIVSPTRRSWCVLVLTNEE